MIVRGEIHNDHEVARKLGYAPKVFTRRVFGWLLTERDMFVGGKRNGKTVDGVFRKKLMRKTSSKGTKWPANVVRIFRGEVFNSNRLDDMSLQMGPGIKRERPFVKIMEFLARGGSVSSQNFMVVPVYRNLPSKKAPYKLFKRMADANQLVTIRDAGRVYWFRRDDPNEESPENDLMFIGVKRIDVKKQFDFQGDWNRRLPTVFVRGRKTIDKAVVDIDKGKVE